MKTIKITITLEVITSESKNNIELALRRGIYRGLDTSPFYVAQPGNVTILKIEQDEKTS